jgi:hypothetical protein
MKILTGGQVRQLVRRGAPHDRVSCLRGEKIFLFFTKQAITADSKPWSMTTLSRAAQVKRFMPLWNDTLVPIIKSNKRLIIAAHGNTLRALVKHLDDIPEVRFC